jgi:hypothetical protein
VVPPLTAEVGAETPGTKVLKAPFGNLLPFSIGAIVIINLSLVRITQDFVGLLNLFEPILSRVISRINIGMVFTCQPPIRFPELGLGYSPFNIQKLIKILLHHPPLLLVIHVDILGIDNLIVFRCSLSSLL